MDIAPITLLYGPNSAGKSAVYTAIKLINQFLSSEGQFRSELRELMRYAHRHDYTKNIVLGARYKVVDFMWPTVQPDESPINLSSESFDDMFPLLAEYFLDRERTNNGFLFEAIFHVSFKETEYHPLHSYHSLTSINEGGRRLFRFCEDGNTWFYLDHPLMVAINTQLEDYGQSWTTLLTTMFPDDDHVIDGNVFKASLDNWMIGGELGYSEANMAAGKRGSKERQMLDVILRLLTALPLHHLHDLCHDMCHIGPLRYIPTERQLTYLFKQISAQTSYAYASLEPSSWSWDDGSIAWKILAENPERDTYYNHFDPSGINLIKAVNDWLISKQRIGMQHKIRSTVGVVKMISSFDNGEKSESEDSQSKADGEFPDRIVKIALEDVNLGISVAVTNVGAGVPQLVPILVAGLMEPSVFIEQPELHLHPKMQTEVSDFLIACRNARNAYFLVETHSEYLALRLLRRVRETNAADIKHRDFSISENDVAFFYFDQIDGVTEIKRLRVSGDGEFIDRWPRGFFAEREAELFDEDD